MGLGVLAFVMGGDRIEIICFVVRWGLEWSYLTLFDKMGMLP